MAYTQQCYRIKNEKFPSMGEMYRYLMEGVHEECVEMAIPMLAEADLTVDDVDMVWDVRDKLFDVLDPEAVIDFDTASAAIQTIYDAQPLIDLRAERDRLIAETDWWVLPDRTPSQEQLDYRQALRDITNSFSSMDDEGFAWPVKPA